MCSVCPVLLEVSAVAMITVITVVTANIEPFCVWEAGQRAPHVTMMDTFEVGNHIALALQIRKLSHRKVE